MTYMIVLLTYRVCIGPIYLFSWSSASVVTAPSDPSANSGFRPPLSRYRFSGRARYEKTFQDFVNMILSHAVFFGATTTTHIWLAPCCQIIIIRVSGLDTEQIHNRCLSTTSISLLYHPVQQGSYREQPARARRAWRTIHIIRSIPENRKRLSPMNSPPLH